MSSSAGGTPPILPRNAAEYIAHNTRRLMVGLGMTYDDLVEASGLDARTIRGLVRGDKQPHSRTLQRLAEALGVSTEELFRAPQGISPEAFDAATNPVVQQVVGAEPALFEGWSPDDFAELNSRFGVGGALTAEGVAHEASLLNRRNQLIDRARVVLASRDAPLLESMIELLYERVTQIE